MRINIGGEYPLARCLVASLRCCHDRTYTTYPTHPMNSNNEATLCTQDAGRGTQDLRSVDLKLADVVVDVRIPGGQPSYTYRVPDALDRQAEPGVLAVVSFHGRTALGYIVNRRVSKPENLGFESSLLKALVGIARGARLSEDLLSLIRFAATEYVGPLWLALHSAVPQSSRSRLRPIVELGDASGVAPGTDESFVVERLQAKGGEAWERELRTAFGDRVLERMRKKGSIRKGWEMIEPPLPRRDENPFRVAPAEAIAKFVEEAGRRKAQAAAAETLSSHAGCLLTPADVKKLGISGAIRDKLISAKLLNHESYRAAFLKAAMPDDNLLAGQSGAVNEICSALGAGRMQRFLLHGVTASGKTEVYLRAAAECLSVGRTALILVPEIALAGQVVERFRERFGGAVSVLHSAMGNSQRYNQWQRIARGDTPIVVGPRSAVFAPLPALGLIVIDEEHEGSYKQGNLLRYDARAVADRRALEAGAVLCLGSATPSVESYHQALSGRLSLLEMPERVSRQTPAPFEVLDLRELRPTKTVISEPLREAIQKTLVSGHQTILFMNRRAFAPFLLCRDCAYVPECVRCSVSLAFHRRDGTLKCHHCGYQTKPPDVCPKCNGVRILPFGLGTQRIEEDLWELFPEARVGRLDRDTRQADEVLDRFRKRDLDILVGTQIVAKGLDFPQVTLVGVVGADTGLHMPDFRAAERTFQLLVQVAGRAGRAKSPGRVLVQTFSPDHPAIRCAANYDYSGFYQREVKIREEAGYPPFRRLAHLIFSHVEQNIARDDSQAVARVLLGEHKKTLELLGPAPSVPERLQGSYRFSLLIKLPPDAHPGHMIQSALRIGGPLRSFVIVDVDPQSLI